jgi:ABC-type phosphate transport system substrate-binding protein
VSRRAIGTALAVLALALGVAACGDLEDDTSGDGTGVTTRGELTSSTTNPTTPARDLPQPEPGVVKVNGNFDGTLSEAVDRKFEKRNNAGGVAVRVEERSTTDESGFADLCDGSVDIAVSSRRITDAELEACSENGLQVVDFQAAYDAIVIATQNEADVGADCVNLAQLRAMFGAGSPVTAWNQLNPNFSVLRIRPTGPEDGTVDFDYFGSRVLGAPDPTLANYRDDYRPFKREVQAKNYVAGRADADAFKNAGIKARRANKPLPKARRQLKRADRALKVSTKALDKAGRQLDNAGKVLDAAVKAEDPISQANAEKVHDKAVRNHKRAEHFHDVAVRVQKKASKRLKKLSRRADKANLRLLRSDRTVPPGAVGIFSFSFYELWEEKLRPLEIDGQTGDRCVFPSEETISSELYPLERTIRLYTTARSLRRPEVQTYIRFHLETAKDFAAALGLIPIPDSTLQDELAKITNPVATQTSAEESAGTTSTDTTATAGTDSTETDGLTTVTDTDATTDETTTDETITEDETTTSTSTSAGGG